MSIPPSLSLPLQTLRRVYGRLNLMPASHKLCAATENVQSTQTPPRCNWRRKNHSVRFTRSLISAGWVTLISDRLLEWVYYMLRDAMLVQCTLYSLHWKELNYSTMHCNGTLPLPSSLPQLNLSLYSCPLLKCLEKTKHKDSALCIVYLEWKIKSLHFSFVQQCLTPPSSLWSDLSL